MAYYRESHSLLFNSNLFVRATFLPTAENWIIFLPSYNWYPIINLSEKLALVPPGVLTVTHLQAFLSSAIGNLYRCFSLYCVLIMSPIMATTITSAVTVVCSRVLPITMTVTMAATPVGLAALDQHNVVLQPQLIPRDTNRASVGLSTVPHEWQTQSQMSS